MPNEPCGDSVLLKKTVWIENGAIFCACQDEQAQVCKRKNPTYCQEVEIVKVGTIASLTTQRDHAQRMVEGARDYLVSRRMCPPSKQQPRCTPLGFDICRKCWSDYLDGLAKEAPR